MGRGLGLGLVAFLAVFGALLGCRVQVAVTPPPPAVSEEPRSGLRALSGEFVAIAERVLPSVVSIDAIKVIPGYRTPFPNDPFLYNFPDEAMFFTPDQRVPTVGSGLVVREDGYLVTNHHVVDGVSEIRVTFSDDQVAPARLIGSDPASDLAVLKVERTGLPTVPWGDSHKLKVGEWVLAFGNPFRMRGSISHGIISGKGRKGLGIADFEDFIQTDAAVNPGNSGGPLVNLDGEVVGINTAILSKSGASNGISLAIPSEVVQSVMGELITRGRVERSWLGIFVQPLDPRVAQRLGVPSLNGLVIAGGYRDGPGGQAGLQSGDVLLEVQGQPVRDERSLRSRLAQTPVGTEVELLVFRRGAVQKVKVKTAARGADSRGRPSRGL